MRQLTQDVGTGPRAVFRFFFFQAEDGIRDHCVTSSDVCSSDLFQDEWLRGGPVRRWVPKAYADKPIYVFETGGSTGVPKSRISCEDFRIDYEAFSATLPDEALDRKSVV